jgi:hypothetical protein
VRAALSPWSPESFQLAYMSAFTALGITPGEAIAKRLAELTETIAELLSAVRAMRDAPEHGRVFAAIDTLSEFRRSDQPITGDE